MCIFRDEHTLSLARLHSRYSFSPQDSPTWQVPSPCPSSACSLLVARLPQPWSPPVQQAPWGDVKLPGGLCLSSVTGSSGPCPAHQAALSQPQPRPPAHDGPLLFSDCLHLVFPCSETGLVTRFQHILTVLVAVTIPAVRHFHASLILGMLCFNMDERYPL